LSLHLEWFWLIDCYSVETYKVLVIFLLIGSPSLRKVPAWEVILQAPTPSYLNIEPIDGILQDLIWMLWHWRPVCNLVILNFLQSVIWKIKLLRWEWYWQHYIYRILKWCVWALTGVSQSDICPAFKFWKSKLLKEGNIPRIKIIFYTWPHLRFCIETQVMDIA
jgi:hypothetical protein